MQNCCGCVNMRKGVLIIGTIGLIGSIVALVLQFVALAGQKQIMKNHEDQIGNNLFSFVFIIGVVVCFFKFISDCLVVYGAVNQTTREISVWLAINLCTIIYTFIMMVVIYVLLVSHESYVSHDNVCILEVFLFTVNVVYTYQWYQVYVFSRQLSLDGRTSLEGIIQNANA